MNLLEIKVAEIEQIRTELTAKVSQAPAFFQHALVVLGFEQLSELEQSSIPLCTLVDMCRELGLLPSAIRGGSASLQQEAKTLGLATLPKSRGKAKKIIEEAVPEETIERSQAPEVESLSEPNTATEDKPTADAASTEIQHERIPTKVITTPIRSGQQIYAANCDLIILSSVSAGAEVLADGNIHIYGALRGRALAGIKGNTNARIFCSSQEAELISIAGEFMVDENLRKDHWKQAVQIKLIDNKISIENI